MENQILDMKPVRFELAELHHKSGVKLSTANSFKSGRQFLKGTGNVVISYSCIKKLPKWQEEINH